MTAHGKYMRIIDLSAKMNETFPELGAELRDLKELDPDLFHQAVKDSDLGKRKAYYLAQIAKVFGPLGIPRTRLIGIGWTKLQIIAPHVAGGDLEQLLALAETNSTYRLRRALAKKPVKGLSKFILLHLTPDQHQVFLKALVAVGFGSKPARSFNREDALTAALQKGLAADQ